MDVTGGQQTLRRKPPGSSKCQGFAGPQLGWTKRDDLPWQWLQIWSTPNKNTPRVVIWWVPIWLGVFNIVLKRFFCCLSRSNTWWIFDQHQEEANKQGLEFFPSIVIMAGRFLSRARGDPHKAIKLMLATQEWKADYFKVGCFWSRGKIK